MIPHRSLGRLSLASLTLLLAGGCIFPATPALLRPPEIASPGHLHAEAAAGVAVLTQAGEVQPLPEVSVGLRHSLGPHMDAGLSLSLDAGVQVDAQIALHHGPRLSIAVDPRVTVGSDGFLSWISWKLSSSTVASATLPVSFGIPLGPDELVVGPMVTGTIAWPGGAPRELTLWTGAGVGLDIPVGKVHLLPELDASCAANALATEGCSGYLMVSLH